MRISRGLSAVVALAIVAFTPVGGIAPAAADVPTDPALQVDRLIETAPFVGSPVSIRDNEGSAYVPADNALWIVSDNDGATFEVDPGTGVLRRVISQTTFAAAPRFGGGSAAGMARADDFESLAYDAAADALYAFSGSSTAVPTVFRLLRNGAGAFQPESWQPLASSQSFTAAGWRAVDGSLYVVQSSTFYPYDYTTNTAGAGFSIPGISRPYGMDFMPDGDVIVVTSSERLFRADFDARVVRPGWNFDLTPFDILDSRGVAVIGDQFFISDGYDARAATDPKEHAVFVLGDSHGSEVVAPTASFTTSTNSGEAPLPVSFGDTSTGTPGTSSWDFGDGTGSTIANPEHVFTTAGSFTVTLTATNGAGSDTASTVITVTAPSETTILTPVGDAYVSSEKVTKNYGTVVDLKLGLASPDYRPYLQFAVGGLSAAPESATLRLYVSNGSPSGGAWYHVTQPWNESTITWSNAPALTGSPIATVGSVPGGAWVEIDVSDIVTGNGAYSFAAISSSSNTARISSREGVFPAELVITEPAQPTAPTASFDPSRTSGEAPLLVDFTDTSTGGVSSWAWDFGDGESANVKNPSHTFTTAGTYTVELTATNAVGSGVASTVITVTDPPPPAAPTASFSASPVSGNAPLSVDFFDTSTGGVETWAWDFGDGTSDTVPNPTHVFGAPGTYTVELTVSNGVGASSTSMAITVNALPAVSTFITTGDAYVSKSSASKNYGDYPDLKLLGPSGQYEYRPYLQFSVSGLAGPPASAVLRVYVTDTGPSGGSWYSVADSWGEGTIKWSNAPALVGTPIRTIGPVTAGTWVEIDVTAAINADGTYSFAASSVDTNTVKLASREGGFPAELVITR